MNCREFRERHLAFLDDSLPEADLVAMQRHLAECPACERRDCAIRRGLLLLRNLAPTIEPSADFTGRLNARLQQLRQHEQRLAAAFHGPTTGGFIAFAAGVVTVGVLAAAALDWTEPPRDIALAPAVVTVPAPPAPPVMDHGYMFSAAAGAPVWPAVMLAEQVPMQVVGSGERLASMGR